MPAGRPKIKTDEELKTWKINYFKKYRKEHAEQLKEYSANWYTDKKSKNNNDDISYPDIKIEQN